MIDEGFVPLDGWPSWRRVLAEEDYPPGGASGPAARRRARPPPPPGREARPIRPVGARPARDGRSEGTMGKRVGVCTLLAC